MPLLRAVAEIAAGRATRRRSSSTATARIGFAEFFSSPTASPSTGRDVRRRPRRPGRGAVGQNNPEWCLTLLGDRRPRGDPRRAQRLVEDRRDPLRPARTPAPRCWWPTRSASSASPASSTSCPDLEARLPDRRRPRRLRWRRRSLHRFDELAGRAAERRSPTRRSTRTTTRSSSTRAARPDAQGRHLDAPQHDRQPAEHDVQRRAVGDARPADDGAGHERARPDRRAAHLAAVPRVGLPLEPGRRHARRAQAGDPRGALRAGQGPPSSSRTKASPSGRRCRRWCGGCVSTPTATTTTRRTVTSVAFGGSPSADELQRMVRETFPNVTSTTNAYGLTESSSVATVITGQDALDQARRRSARRCRRRPARSSTPPATRSRPGETGRGAHQGPDHHAGLLEQAGGHGRDRASTGGCTPATSATSTRTASSSSPTGPRT